MDLIKHAAILSIVLWCAVAFAQQNAIHRVSVVGTEATSPELVRINSGLTEGELFSHSKLEEATKSIYTLGNYEDVRIITTPGPYGYDIEIRVVEFPRVESIEFKGNDEIDTDDLQKLLGIVQGGFLSNAALFDAIKKMEAKYAENKI